MNKYGYCMYGDTCRYKHVDEICVDENCSVFQCERRICNYYREYQDVNLQPSADINMKICTMKMKKLNKLKLD